MRLPKVINLGIGNINAFVNIHRSIGSALKVVQTPDEIFPRDIILLVGNGSFDAYMTQLEQTGFKSRLVELNSDKLINIVGFCVGAQVLGFSSEEGNKKGLGFLPYNVCSLRKITTSLPLPHMKRSQVKWSPFSNVMMKSEVSYFY